jgi:hypothetical protein
MVFNTTFNNISVILWQSVLLVEGTGVPKPNTDELWVNSNINDVMPSKCSVDNSGFYFTNNINLLF